MVEKKEGQVEKKAKEAKERKEIKEKILKNVTGKEKKGNIFKRFFRNTHLIKFIVYWGGVAAVLVWLFWGLPNPTKLGQNAPVSTKIFDRSGKLIYEIYADKQRTPVKLSDLPTYVPQATIAIEDKDFYKNYVLSPTGVIRAVYNTIFKGSLQGGSTLTQQLVKNAFLSPERTIRRKIREFVLAMAVEALYSKNQILETYLNEIPYGSTAYGIEAASELYFAKPAKDLDIAEASLLAGLTQSPTAYSPFGAHPELAQQRQKEVLRRMVEDKYITQEQADNASKEELKFAQPRAAQAPHFALWIKDQLVQKYGELMVEQGGLRVETTLDLDLQNFAQDAVATEVGKLKGLNVKNGAVLVTHPQTGEVLAMVGSKDYFATDEDGKVNVIFAPRQPGSSIKPLNYALGLKDKKITAATILADVPTCFSVAGQAGYCPVNYDGKFHGGVGVRFALGNSFNIPAVRVLALNHVDNFINFANSLGISTFKDPSQYGLSLTLGGGEVTVYDMAEAYGVFANGGLKVPLVAITKVSDWTGKVLEETKVQDTEGDRVLSNDVTYLISHILLDNNARTEAFGSSSYLVVSGHPEASVKTGTTNDRRDNWTIGYTPQIVVATWVGNNDNTPMSGAVSGISGASPIWNKVIKNALDKSEKGTYDKEDDGHAWPKQPSNVVGATICANTGFVPTGPKDNPGCPTRFEYFIDGTVPASKDPDKTDLQLDKTTHAVASSKEVQEHPEFVETQNHPVIFDPLKTLICLDCAMPTDPVFIGYPFNY
ncbi:MAG TPA: transglycosylase domain-containing protein [Patescibacteria group bacterium]